MTCLHSNFSYTILGDRDRWVSDPVHQHDDESWWWYDETWADEHGPWRDEAEARNSLQVYITEYL